LGCDVRPCSGADYDEIEFVHDIYFGRALIG